LTDCASTSGCLRRAWTRPRTEATWGSLVRRRGDLSEQRRPLPCPSGTAAEQRFVHG
jgi:hypothetical protein